MKKFLSVFILMFAFLLAKPAQSLDIFIYWEAAFDAEGEIVSMAYIEDYYDTYQDFLDNFGVRITILDDDGDLYQEIHGADRLEWDQFGNYYVEAGNGEPEDGYDTEDFEDIVVKADTRIKFEITFNQGREWILSSVKGLSTLGDIWQLFFQGGSIKSEEGGNGDSKSTIERARKVVKPGASFNDHMLKNGELRLRFK